jgi:8-amino-7-oxononanoate synthase
VRFVTRELAALLGCERATLAASTLHLFWDLFGTWRPDDVSIFVDSGAYPIARWGVERARGRGTAAAFFRHHDAGALLKALESKLARGTTPVIVADGYCTGCGAFAPVREYASAARRFGGCLVIDDTQALGIFGAPLPHSGVPLRVGGGGTLAVAQLSGPDLVVVASLAKGFGAPLAMLAGSEEFVADFEARSETRTHCSPPSLPALFAAERAVRVNRCCGERMRGRLSDLVERFRSALAATAVRLGPGVFPVQAVAAPALDPESFHQRLLDAGVRALLHQPSSLHGPRVSFLLTAAHTPDVVERAIEALVRTAGGKG